LKEMYKGKANWEEIAKAAGIVHKTDTIILGNGDVQNRLDAEKRAKKYHVDGVLIGRAALGNPWVFSKERHAFIKNERFRIALEHTKYFVKLRGEKRLFEMRKYWGAYIKGFDGARELRLKLMAVSSLVETANCLIRNVTESDSLNHEKMYSKYFCPLRSTDVKHETKNCTFRGGWEKV